MFVAGVFAVAPFWARQFLLDNPITVAFSDRAPSSIQKMFDYSDLVGSALQSAARQRLMDSVQITAQNGDVLIQMGNFVLLNEGKQKDFACGYYDKVSFEFEAQGVLVDGEKPKLTLQSACEVASNVNFMNPFKVPITQLKLQKPAPSEYKFFEGSQPVTVSLENSPDAWPSNWILKSVKMTNSKVSSRSLVIDSFRLSMKW